jgi:hypothetical protein
MDLSTGKDGDSASKDLLKRCLEDPYLKELQMNLLADAEGVQCFGKSNGSERGSWTSSPLLLV